MQAKDERAEPREDEEPAADRVRSELIVTVGCWVRVLDRGQEDVWRIVPQLEADARRHRMGEDAPLARALLGHAAGDDVVVAGPLGRRRVRLMGVVRGLVC